MGCKSKIEAAQQEFSLKAAENLPTIMQGRWVSARDPSYEVIVDGAIIRVMGAVVAYDYFRITEQDGALTVELEVNDPAEEDGFQRRNIAGLVITPEGEFFVYNVKFSEQLVRP